MSKKSKRKNELTEENLMSAMTEMSKKPVAPITDTPASKPAPTLTSALLKDVRNAALKISADAAHNIAELESWRNEIDATIAFLRSQRK